MRIPYLGLFIIILVNLSVDWYIFRYLHSEFRNRIWSKIQLVSALILTCGLVALFFIPLQTISDGMIRTLMWSIFAYISIYLPKYIFVIFDCISRIPNLFGHKRWKAVTGTGAVIGAILFVAFWWGALFNRFNIDVKEVDVEIPELPAAFNGFRIAQISDMHLGTYGNDTTFIDKIVEEINSLKPDVILFTGDIVNRETSELEPFVSTLSRLKSRFGVYSVLGNHDYGDYYRWDTPEAQELNNEKMEVLQKKMGWELLKNDYRIITEKGDTLVLIGVENIGDPPFHIYGDLHKAYPTPEDSKTKILLSHNPSHWVKEIENSDNNIALTLSGHTHAMQISFLGFSPAVFRYKTWGGLYSDDSDRHKLYVNIGTGTVGFPARIGASPEITLLTLKGTDTPTPSVNS